MRWRKKWLNIFSSLYYTNFTAAKVWQENEKNYSVIHMNWSVFPKNHPGNSLSINTLVYLTNMREKLPSERTQPSIPTARARILGQQADPQTLAEAHAQIKRPARQAVRRLALMGRAESDYCLSASASSSIKPIILKFKNIPAFGQDILHPHLD